MLILSLSLKFFQRIHYGVSVLLLCCAIVPASGQSSPEEYFNQGLQGLNGDWQELESAAAAFHHIIVNYPKDPLYPRALYNYGFAYFKLEAFDTAIQVFRQILQTSLNEKESDGHLGLMGEVYANYKHRASSLLSDIYFQEGVYDSALYFLALADTVYPYLHFCGNEYAAKHISFALRYAKLYQIFGRDHDAVKVLVGIAFKNRLASNREAIDSLGSLLKRLYNPPQLRLMLDSAIQNITFRLVNTDDGRKYPEYYLHFLGNEIAIETYFYGDPLRGLSIAMQEVKDSPLHRLIQNL